MSDPYEDECCAKCKHWTQDGEGNYFGICSKHPNGPRSEYLDVCGEFEVAL